MQISSIISEGIPALSIAAFPAVIAKCLAGTSFNAPRKSPIAVLQALTITTSFKPIHALLNPYFCQSIIDKVSQ
jgi:hypothetical protein